MPLFLNTEGDHEYHCPGVDSYFLSTWNALPLTAERVSQLMDYAYGQGVSKGEGTLGKIRQILKEE